MRHGISVSSVALVLVVLGVLAAHHPRVLRADDEPPAAAVTPQVEVLSEGQEPRRSLALAPRPKTVQNVEANAELKQTIRVGDREVPGQSGPPMQVRLEYAVDRLTPEGDIAWRAVLRGIGLTPSAKVSPERRKGFEAATELMHGTTQHGVMSPHGVVKTGRLEFVRYLPTSAEKRLRSTFKRVMPQGFKGQPTQPLGTGARWKATWTEDDEWSSRMESTVEITKLDENGYEATFEIVQTADEQDLPPGMFPRATSTVRLLGLKGSGKGSIVQRFNEVAPREMTLTLDVTLDLKPGRGTQIQGLQRTDHLSMTIKAEAPRPEAPTPAPTWDPPSAEEALAVTRKVLDLVRSGDLEAGGEHIDHETLVQEMFRGHIDKMQPDERKKLLETHGPAVGQQILELNRMHRLLEEGRLTLGEPEVVPPRRNRIMVTFLRKSGRRSEPEHWLLEKSDGRVRLVDKVFDDGFATSIGRSMYEAMHDTSRVSPLDMAREMLGLPPDLEGHFRRLGIEVPLVSAKPAELPAAKRTELLVTFLVGKDGRVHARTARGSVDVDLGTFEPQEQRMALDSVSDLLQSAGGGRNADGSSKLRVLLRADRRAKWRYVKWLDKLFQHPSIRIGDVAAEVVGPDGAKGAVPLVAVKRPQFAGHGAARAKGPDIVIKLFRREMNSRTKAYTRVKVGSEKSYDLPRGWSGLRRESDERKREHEAALAQIAAEIGKRIESSGKDAKDVTCRILNPPPKGGAVPLADVVRILLAARSTGMQRVEFQHFVIFEEDLEETKEDTEEAMPYER